MKRDWPLATPQLQKIVSTKNSKLKTKNSQDRRIWLLIGATALVAALFVPFSQVILHVEYDYTLRTVALGGALLGVVSGVLGLLCRPAPPEPARRRAFARGTAGGSRWPSWWPGATWASCWSAPA